MHIFSAVNLVPYKLTCKYSGRFNKIVFRIFMVQNDHKLLELGVYLGGFVTKEHESTLNFSSIPRELPLAFRYFWISVQ
jgi:hypothetical protein